MGLSHDTHQAADLDFSLVWPDSEDLFQTLMSSEGANEWQMPIMPLGAFPPPPATPESSNNHFESPNFFGDRSSSIGNIPSGGSHQAVRDVTDMVTSSVRPQFVESLLVSLTKTNTLFLVFQRNCCDKIDIYHFCFPRPMSAHVFRALYPRISDFTSGNLCLPGLYASLIA